MAFYRIGSMGLEVRQLQAELHQRNLYVGPIDGVFGGGTEAAIRCFQTTAKIRSDGVVGPETWGALFGRAAPIPSPNLISRPLDERCLALTGSFETSMPPPDCFAAVSGDFDGMGMSFGALQWNTGQRSLQPILLTFDAAHPDVIDSIFGSVAAELRAMLGSFETDHEIYIG